MNARSRCFARAVARSLAAFPQAVPGGRCVLALCCAALPPMSLAEEEGRPSLLFPTPPVVWFPPGVPVSGELIADVVRPSRDNAGLEPPSGLAEFVNEYFYPALSTRLNSRVAGSRRLAHLDEYRARRGALLNELADQIVALHGKEEDTRRAELQAFAAQQSPQIIALERVADELRRSLIDGGLMYGSVDWSRRRRWTVGVTAFAGEHAEKEAEFQIVRAAAYYQDGLVVEQRGLLLEVASELQIRAQAARPVPVPRRDDPAAMFFSPATARMRLPKNAPPGLLALMGRFNREKTALKQELREAVWAHDRTPREERTAVFTALADQQWPRLVELEKRAEEIRLVLAKTPRAPLAAPPHIPPRLLERIRAYNRDREDFIREFDDAMLVASMMVRPPAVDSKMPEDVRVQLARKLAEERAAMREKVAREFHEDTRERFLEMRGRFDAIQADLALMAAGQFDPETGRPLSAQTLLDRYSSAMERFDVFGREEVIYRGYRTAMLMPGLSPEQRRLLFGAALVGLAQPLPYGERLPSKAQPVPQE